MARTRREFLAKGSMGLVGAAVAVTAAKADGCGLPVADGAHTPVQGGGQVPSTPGVQVPGQPGAVETSAAAGPAVSAETFLQAEKLVQVEMSAKERAEAAGNWWQNMAVLERRVGPRRLAIGYDVVPATVWNPLMPKEQGGKGEVTAPQPRVSHMGMMSLLVSNEPPRGSDEDIAFASVWQLSRWIEAKQLKSERLTKIYLERLERFNKELNCVITLTADHALEQARKADAEVAAGEWRSPLHGVPWGAKDLLDTAGIRTTWGAAPFKDRVPVEDATVTKRLNEAGAVLVAKLSLGALADNDIWFGGQTMNPWNLDEGASGSSAGPAAAVAAGLVGFAIGSDTQGSIVSPSMRCGVTGLRPTFGRVPRTGSMTVSWTCDKLGALARSVMDTMMVLKAVAGPDEKDVACIPAGLEFDALKSVTGLRVGYFPEWMKVAPATEVDRAAMETVKKLGMELVPVTLPDWPYDSLNVILLAESAAVFEEITLNHQVDEMLMQTPDAWPNTLRQSRFLSAVDFVQADRMRRMVAVEMDRVMRGVDLLLVPSLRDEFLVITSFTGHPSLTLRAGFVEVSEERSDWTPDPEKPLKKFSPPRRVPHGVSLAGRLFDEGTIARVGMAMEAAFNVAGERPAGF